jgi:hypothetical protein
MSDTHVLSALRAKRAEISGCIHDLEKKVRIQRERLAHIDATIRVFSPDTDPNAIAPKRRYRRAVYFKRNEIPRLCLEHLRTLGAPATASAIADALIVARELPNAPGLKADVVERVLAVLRALRKRRTVTKTGTSRDARWSLAA